MCKQNFIFGAIIGYISSKKIWKILLLGSTLFAVEALQAQAEYHQGEKYAIHFPINESSVKDDYLSNKATLLKVKQVDWTSFQRVYIESNSSMDGRYSNNLNLSLNRGNAIRSVLQKTLKRDAKSAPIFIQRVNAEEWDKVRKALQKECSESHFKEIDSILSSTQNWDEKEIQLKRNLSKEHWQILKEEVLPQSRVVVFWGTWPKRRVEISPRDKHHSHWLTHQSQVLPLWRNIPFDIFAHKTILAFKTNLLTDALTWLNYSIEIPFSKNRFSAVFEHQFPWWRFGEGDNEFCMRFLQIGGEVRWWFHPRQKPSTRHQIIRDRLSGHYLGLYGMAGKWDFENGRKICYQGEFWSTGLSYGYSLPIGKHLNLEFSLSLGYANIPYRHFVPSEDYHHLYRDCRDAGTWNYWGLTKIGISLVVPIQIKRIVRIEKGGGK